MANKDKERYNNEKNNNNSKIFINDNFNKKSKKIKIEKQQSSYEMIDINKLLKDELKVIL